MRVRLAPRVYEGSAVAKLDIGRDLPWLDPATQQARDVARFDKFSDGFSASDPASPNRIVDVRYSFVPNEISALFSIELDPAAGENAHVKYRTHREQAREQMGRLWKLIAG